MGRLKWGFLVGILLLTACAHPKVSTMPRPDTRGLAGVIFSYPVGDRIIQLFFDSLPNENGFCAIGETIKDVNGQEGLLVTDIFVTRQDSASPVGIFFTPKNLHKAYTEGLGCEGIPFLIGFGHDHPTMSPGWSCTGSDNDALFLAGDKRFLFLLTFCLDGRFETLWQDGRRQAGWWKHD